MANGPFLVEKTQHFVFNEEEKNLQKLSNLLLRRIRFATSLVLSTEIKAVVSRNFLKIRCQLQFSAAASVHGRVKHTVKYLDPTT